jgi:hypothetical protein
MITTETNITTISANITIAITNTIFTPLHYHHQHYHYQYNQSIYISPQSLSSPFIITNTTPLSNHYTPIRITKYDIFAISAPKSTVCITTKHA